MFTYIRNERKWVRETTLQPPSQYQVQESILFYILCGWFRSYIAQYHQMYLLSIL